MRLDGNTPISALYHSDICNQETDEIFHYGVKGMKWGVRRYQNKDGGYTAAGRIRYGSSASASTSSSNSIQKQIDTLKAETLANGKAAAGYAAMSLGGAGVTALMLSSGWINPQLAAATVVTAGLSAGKAAQAAIGSVKISALKRQLKKGETELKETKTTEKDIRESRAPKVDKVEVDSFADKFKTDRYGNYEARISTKVGTVDGVEVAVSSSKGKELENSTAAANFLKRYDLNKAKNGIVKEYYDGENSWIDKDPSGDNYYSRSDFKNKIKPTNIDIDSENNTYLVYWSDGGTYGGHVFVDEGSTKDMKVRYRSLEG